MAIDEINNLRNIISTDEPICCIGMINVSGNHIYALNGAPEYDDEITKRARMAIEGLYGPGTQRADVDFSFTIFPTIYNYDDCYNLIGNLKDFYRNLRTNKNNSISLNIKDLGIVRYNDFSLKLYGSRTFSCVERKLIAWCYLNKKPLSMIYVTSRPCGLCLLCVPSCRYYDGHRVCEHEFEIHRSSNTVTWHFIKTK